MVYTPVSTNALSHPTAQLVQFEFVEFDYVTPEGQGAQVMVRRRGSIATSVTLRLSPREYSNGVPATGESQIHPRLIAEQ